MTLLRERMQHDMLIRNLAENTQTSRLLQVSSFGHHSVIHPFECIDV